MKKLTLFIFFLLSLSRLDAQELKKNEPKSRPYHFQVGLNHLDNYVYTGRSDSLKTPYLFPTLSFQHDMGLYIDAGFYYYIDKEEGGFDFLELNALYEFNLTKRLSASVYGTKYIYNGTSDIITGYINTILGTNLNYDWGLFSCNIEGDLMFGNGHTDIYLSPGIERKIELGKKKNWSLNPNFYVNFSSLYFYEGFVAQKVNTKNVRRPGSGSATIESMTTVSDPKLKLLDYELSLPITYENKYWGVTVNPTLAIPTNSIQITTRTTRKLPNGTTQFVSQRDSTPYSEKYLKPVIFTQISIFLKF